MAANNKGYRKSYLFHALLLPHCFAGGLGHGRRHTAAASGLNTLHFWAPIFSRDFYGLRP